jgi:hypothetical protein
MSFWDDFTGKSQRKDAKRGYRDSVAMLDEGKTAAEGQIKGGYAGADANYSRERDALTSAYTKADSLYGNTPDYLAPYDATGRSANTLYANALGLNGIEAQKAFGENYAASDPFRAQNAELATEQLMKALNARGLSGSGYGAEAVARQNLMQGSQDYQNYLNNLFGMQQQGQSAAAQRTQFAQNTAANRAGLSTNYGNALAGTYRSQGGLNVDRGNALADLSYGNAQQKANMRTGLANAVAQSRSVGINNLLGVAGLGVKAYTAGMGGKAA